LSAILVNICELYSPIQQFITDKNKTHSSEKIELCVFMFKLLKFLLITTSVNKGGRSPPLGAKNFKGVALKTHQRLRLWKLQAFEKA
jgi:hypothetical protein